MGGWRCSRRSPKCWVPQRDIEKETADGEQRGRTEWEASAREARWSESEMSPLIASSLDLSSVPASPLRGFRAEKLGERTAGESFEDAQVSGMCRLCVCVCVCFACPLKKTLGSRNELWRRRRALGKLEGLEGGLPEDVGIPRSDPPRDYRMDRLAHAICQAGSGCRPQECQVRHGFLVSTTLKLRAFKVLVS